MLRKVLLLMFFIYFVLGCNLKNSYLDGYYYDDKIFNIYHFKKSTLIKYNLFDSTYIKQNYKMSKKILKIDNKQFSYKTNNDTLIISDYKTDIEKSKLIKFNLIEFGEEKIKNKVWKTFVDRTIREKNKKYKQEQFVQINFNNGIEFFYKDDKIGRKFYKQNSIDTIYYGTYRYRGKYFDKFHLFNKALTTFILNNTKDDTISFIKYGGNNDTYHLILNDCNCKIQYPDTITHYGRRVIKPPTLQSIN